ncbi:type II toxin-antitoxin system HicA family toxin [Candidatus Acetothermia bacterium]|nr:type II toxin-antitoxin system HicA family toxin [Candidatus Acetothermia bacterium]
MPRLSATDWKIQAKIFENFGCTLVRQHGSHLVYEYPHARRPVVILKYDEVPVTIIRANMSTVGMTREQYFELLKPL